MTQTREPTTPDGKVVVSPLSEDIRRANPRRTTIINYKRHPCETDGKWIDPDKWGD